MIYSLQIYMNGYKLEDTLVIDDRMKWGRIDSDEIKFPLKNNDSRAFCERTEKAEMKHRCK